MDRWIDRKMYRWKEKMERWKDGEMGGEGERDSEPQPADPPWAGSLWHPCTADLSYSLLPLKLPPPPCAVLLVSKWMRGIA